MEPTTFIGIIAGILTIPVLAWAINSNKPLPYIFRVIDFSFLTFFATLALGRVYGMLYYSEQIPWQWRLLPVDQVADRVEWFGSLPWIPFNVFDGSFFLFELLSGFLLAHVFFALFNGKRLSLLKITQERQQAFAITALALVPLSFAAVINGYLAVDFEPDWSLMLPLFLILTALLILNLALDTRSVKVIMVLSALLPLLILNLTAAPSASEQGLLLVNFFSLAASVIAILLLYLEQKSYEQKYLAPKRVKIETRRY